MLGDPLADASLFRTARSGNGHPALAALVKREVSLQAAMMICKASDTEKSGLGMRRVLTQNQVDGLARGAETDGRTLCYAHRAVDGNSVQPSTRFGQTSQTPLQLIPVNGWLVMSAIRCIMRTTSPSVSRRPAWID